MKKVLVITLVLVMAFASSAMAAVTFSGNFTATAKMTSFKVFTENYSLDPTFEFNMAAANKSETEEVVNWIFQLVLSLRIPSSRLANISLAYMMNTSRSGLGVMDKTSLPRAPILA